MPHYTDLELSLLNIPFLVSGDYSPADPGDSLNPPNSSSFDISTVRIVGLPNDPEDLLASIHTQLRLIQDPRRRRQYTLISSDGFDLLEELALAAIEES